MVAFLDSGAHRQPTKARASKMKRRQFVAALGADRSQAVVGGVSISALPPWTATMAATMARPRPIPSRRGAVGAGEAFERQARTRPAGPRPSSLTTSTAAGDVGRPQGDRALAVAGAFSTRFWSA